MLKAAAGALLLALVFVLNVAPTIAATPTSSGDVTLTNGEGIARLNRHVNIIQLSRWRACSRSLHCSHPGALYRGDDFVALTDGGHFIEATCIGPTRAIGIQLRGDENDGYARVLIDEQMVWTGNTYGYGRGGHPYVKYLKIEGLSQSSHTARVEAVGRPGRAGGDVHVAVVGFACYPAVRLYLPAAPQFAEAF